MYVQCTVHTGGIIYSTVIYKSKAVQIVVLNFVPAGPDSGRQRNEILPDGHKIMKTSLFNLLLHALSKCY